MAFEGATYTVTENGEYKFKIDKDSFKAIAGILTASTTALETINIIEYKSYDEGGVCMQFFQRVGVGVSRRCALQRYHLIAGWVKALLLVIYPVARVKGTKCAYF